MFFLAVFSKFLFFRQDKSRSLLRRPEGKKMMTKLALAEMPQIDHRVSQTFQSVVQPTDTFKP